MDDAKFGVSYTLHASNLSPAAVELLALANLPSSIANPLREFMVLTRDDTGSTHAIWLEDGLVLTPNLSNKPPTVKGYSRSVSEDNKTRASGSGDVTPMSEVNFLEGGRGEGERKARGE